MRRVHSALHTGHVKEKKENEECRIKKENVIEMR
jgi:hypothetical protein